MTIPHPGADPSPSRPRTGLGCGGSILLFLLGLGGLIGGLVWFLVGEVEDVDDFQVVDAPGDGVVSLPAGEHVVYLGSDAFFDSGVCERIRRPGTDKVRYRTDCDREALRAAGGISVADATTGEPVALTLPGLSAQVTSGNVIWLEVYRASIPAAGSYTVAVERTPAGTQRVGVVEDRSGDSPLPAILAAVGGLAVLGAVVLAIVTLVRRSRHRREPVVVGPPSSPPPPSFSPPPPPPPPGAPERF